jgi:type VI secretion system protein ImpJ
LVSSQLADGSFVLSSELIPPVTSYGADPVLAGWLSHLHGACRMRAGSLAARLTGSDGKSSEAVEVADFLLLQILNRYEPLLAHWLQVRDTSPEQVFITLQTLIGELSTYVRPATRRSTVRPDYKHLEPHKHFGPLFAEVQALLNDVLVRSAQSIPLAPRANGVSVASVAPAELQGFSGLVFAIAANMPPDQLAALFPARCKVAPADRLAELIRLQLPGIALQVLPVPPRQIPFNAGFVYFQVESHGALWEQMAAHGGIGLHVGGDFPGLNLQLWGVRGK